MLNDRTNDPPRLLENLLVAPVLIKRRQLSSEAIVQSQENNVQRRQSRLFAQSIVPGTEATGGQRTSSA